jgi:HSP20 family protein
MAVVRWDPWRELSALERQFDEVFGRAGRQMNRGQDSSGWVPALDVHQEGDTLVVCAEVAGIDPDKVDITVDEDVLTISGSTENDRTVEEGNWIRRERQTGSFRRAVTLPHGIDPESIQANARNGVIEIRIPQPPASEPHRIPLKSGEGESSAVQVTDGSSGGDSKGSKPRKKSSSGTASN